MLDESTELRDHLEEVTAYYRKELVDNGFDIIPGTHPCVPVMLYDEKTAAEFAKRMMEKGVKIELNSKITYVDENTIKYEKNHQEYVLDDVDTLDFAVGYNPVASPIENAHLIGDCQKVGTLKDAITNAYQITKEI